MPGATVFTMIPSGASARDRFFEALAIAAFDAVNPMSPGLGVTDRRCGHVHDPCRRLPLLRQATFARVVNVAASSIRHQSPGLIGFTASKAAMASASKNLSRALAPEGIIVNTVAPGTVMSPTLASYLVGTDLEGLPEGPLEAAYEAIARDYGASNDVGRVGLPEEVATMVVFLCSELCSFVVGATVPVDGGTDFF